MSTKQFNTRIITKHAELEALENSTLTLLEGEIVLAKVDVPQPDGSSTPTFVAKIGNGNTFANSPWLFAKASDVYSWAKKQSLDVNDIPALSISKVTGLQVALDSKLATATFETYKSETATTLSDLRSDIDEINTNLSGYATDEELKTVSDKANTNAEAIAAINHTSTGILKTAKDYADQVVANEQSRALGVEGGLNSRLTTAEGAITTLNGEGAGSVKKALADAKAYTDQEIEKVSTANTAAANAQAAANKAQEEVDALEGVVSAMDTRLTAADTSTLNSAKSYAESQDTALHTTISAEIDSDVQAAKDALQENIDKKVDETIYSAKMTALEGADTAQVNRITALENKVKDVSNVMDFVGAVSAKPADGATGYQAGDVVIVTSGDDAGKEFVYDGSSWHEFGFADANTSAISTLQEKVTTLEGKVDVDKVSTAINSAIAIETSNRQSAISTVQGNIDTLSGTVSTNRSAFDNYVTSNNEAVTDLDSRLDAAESDIDTLQTGVLELQTNSATKTELEVVSTAVTNEETRAKKAEADNAAAIKSISDDYLKSADAAALTTEINKKVDKTTYESKISDLETADAAEKSAREGLESRITALEDLKIDETYAKDSDLDALKTRVTTAEGEIDTLQTDVDAIELNYLRNNNGTLFIGADEVIFDCGGAE